MLISGIRLRVFACAVAVLSIAGLANAALIISGTHTDHPVTTGSLGDVRMQIELSASGGLATMTFTNVSVWPEESVVFKRIVVDTLDDDTGNAVLWNGTILTNTPDVSYTLQPYIVLPGYNPLITDGSSMVQFEADPSPPQKGLGPGEFLQVQFDTSLPDGADIDDYLAFFNGGADTAAYTIGFHAISADVVDGESLSGAPEPATLGLLGFGAVIMALRRRKTSV